jgi:Uma2 family endonuclease
MGVVTTLPRGRGLVVEDLEAMPDDGNRYELIDGVLVVTPSPGIPHQWAQAELFGLLREHCPPDLKVLMAPLDVLSPDTAVQPDILVARRSDLTGTYLTVPPLLAVEVLSPSTRAHDLNVKFIRYQRYGVPSYWAVDPEQLTLVAWELRDGRYVEVADVGPDDSWAATRPFPVTVHPGRLRD